MGGTDVQVKIKRGSTKNKNEQAKWKNLTTWNE